MTSADAHPAGDDVGHHRAFQRGVGRIAGQQTFQVMGGQRLLPRVHHRAARQNILTGGDGHYHPERADADRLATPGTDLTYRLTDHGRQELTTLGLDLPALARKKPAIRYRVDWSEQRHSSQKCCSRACTGWLRL